MIALKLNAYVLIATLASVAIAVLTYTDYYKATARVRTISLRRVETSGYRQGWVMMIVTVV
jgi:hypothetical protein